MNGNDKKMKARYASSQPGVTLYKPHLTKASTNRKIEHLLAVIPQATFLYLKVALGANALECVNGNDKN